MKVCWLWHGGPNYALPYPDDKPEVFASLKEAKEEFASRVDDDYYPGMEEPIAWVFKGEEAGEYPDWVLQLGPRGGVKVERG
jgi:hypothetical protein